MVSKDGIYIVWHEFESRHQILIKNDVMEKIDNKEFEESKKINTFYIYKLVKKINNDTELGGEIRRYINKTIRND